jgi:hypothetical protein
MANMCEEVECPYAESQCMNDGQCDPETGDCLESYKDANTPCDDGDAGTINDMCDGHGGCHGTEEGPGLPYVGAYGKWGWTCCLVMTLVMDGPVSAIQLTATDYIGDLSAYSLDISNSMPGQPDIEVSLPAGTMQPGQTFMLTNNMTTFLSIFAYSPANYSQGLPKLDGTEMIHLQRTPSGSGDDYLIDYFPPTNDSWTFPWADSIAYRNVYSNWKLDLNVFQTNVTLNVPWSDFSLFGTFDASCTCQPAKADRIENGKALCRTASSSHPISDFQDPQLSPAADFGSDWHFVEPSIIEGLDGKWECTVTPPPGF